MRALLVLGLLGMIALSGCVSDGGDPEVTPTPTPAGPNEPVTVVDETLDFSGDPSGAAQERAVTFPEGARELQFGVEWSSATPVVSTSGVRVALLDPDGEEAAECDIGTNAVTQASNRACGPITNNVRAGDYTLRWEGFGPIQAHVVVVAR